MIRTNAAVCAISLTVTGLLAVTGCGGSGGGAAATGPAAATAAGTAAGTAASTASTGAAGTSSVACTGGLTGAEPGVMDIFCNGPARVHVQAGSVVKEFTGGKCSHVGDIWTATDGVVTQAGVYKGKPVDVVSVNRDSTGGGTIQLVLGGKVLLVEGAVMKVSDGGNQAHLQGTTTSLSDEPKLPVTVDISCL